MLLLLLWLGQSQAFSLTEYRPSDVSCSSRNIKLGMESGSHVSSIDLQSISAPTVASFSKKNNWPCLGICCIVEAEDQNQGFIRW